MTGVTQELSETLYIDIASLLKPMDFKLVGTK